jgi:cyclophilin family peptidyl-prolyl cis-trans isomerase
MLGRAVAGLAGACVVAYLGLWVWRNGGAKEDMPEALPAAAGQAQVNEGRGGGPAGPESGTKKAGGGGSFLEAFGKKAGPAGDSPAEALTDAELEKKLHELLEVKEQLRALATRARGWQGKASPTELRQALGERSVLEARLNQGVAPFEKDLARARRDRPTAAVPEWLTGELLILVGGEPEEILPHLRRAVERGLARPRLFASLARVQTEANQLKDAFRSAGRALDLDGADRYAWQAFTRAAFNTEHFAEVSARLARSFPGKGPDWAEDMRREAAAWQTRWRAEEKLRQAERRADDLPRVRLVIEHRRFARDAGGTTATARVESTGRGEVVVELFEDQAPQTVANFLSLVEHKVYDGTRFYLAEPAALAAGGDPGSRSGDVADDGTGGPGYVIPDEFDRPGARGHFRGSLSMVNHGPHTAGSQFFMTFVPMHEMDGRFTVFGRVIRGQEVIDRITLGRTNREVGHFGRIVPGDLLVRAEVLRKRPHEYRVTRQQPP